MLNRYRTLYRGCQTKCASCKTGEMNKHSGDSVDDGYSREKEERTSECKMESHMPTRLERVHVREQARKWTGRRHI